MLLYDCGRTSLISNLSVQIVVSMTVQVFLFRVIIAGYLPVAMDLNFSGRTLCKAVRAELADQLGRLVRATVIRHLPQPLTSCVGAERPIRSCAPGFRSSRPRDNHRVRKGT